MQARTRTEQPMSKEHERILAWQKADALAVAIFKVVRAFPQGEGTVGPALRRAALAVPTEVAVAHGLRGNSEAFEHARRAIAAANEIQYLLHFSVRIGYLKEGTYQKIQGPVEELTELVGDFHQALQL